MPGGFGTLDELFESLTLVQTGKTPHRPVILVGRSFWQGLADWIHSQLLTRGFIAPSDTPLFEIIDDADAVIERVFRHYENYTDGFCVNPKTDWELGL